MVNKDVYIIFFNVSKINFKDHDHTSLLRAPRLRNDLYCVEWDVKLYTVV